MGGTSRWTRRELVVIPCIFALGATVAGLATGALVGQLGAIVGLNGTLRIAAGTLVAGVAVVYGVAEGLGIQIALPSRRWMVPRDWGSFGPIPAAFLYGAALGTGLMTFVNFIGMYLLFAILFLAADPTVGAAIFSTFALARSLPIVTACFAYLTHDDYRRATPRTHRTRTQQVYAPSLLTRSACLLAAAGFLFAKFT